MSVIGKSQRGDVWGKWSWEKEDGKKRATITSWFESETEQDGG